MRKSMNEFANLLNAQDPLLYVHTYEENEFVSNLCEKLLTFNLDANQRKKVPCQVYVYTRPLGLRRINLINPTMFNPEDKVNNVNNIIEALNYVNNIQQDIAAEQSKSMNIMARISKNEEKDVPKDTQQSSIFIFKDLHLYYNDKDVLRMLRDIKENYSSNIYTPIIVTSPVVEIPTELEKLFTLWEFPLMTKEEISDHIVNMFPNELFSSEEEKNNVIEACCGLTEREIMKALAHSFHKNMQIKAMDVYEEKIQLVKKSGCLDYLRPNHTIDDLGGCDNFKDWIKKVKESLSPEAREFGIPSPKGAMLVGVPGTSKTASAEILASYLKVPLLALDMAKIMGSFVGQSERTISNALRIAKSIAPCILLIDECEKGFSGVASSASSDAGTLSRVMGQLLTFLQDNDGVIVMMTSNDVSQLPPELTRSGRIDTQWMFDLPNKYERNEIIRIYLDKNKLNATEENVNYLADKTENYTGAEIKSLVKDILVNTYYRQKTSGASLTRYFEKQDIEDAVKRTVTVYRSSKEKIEAFRSFAKDRYLNASKSIEEIKAIRANIKKPEPTHQTGHIFKFS